MPLPRNPPSAATLMGQKRLLTKLFTRLQSGLNAPPEESEIKDLNALLTLFEKLNALHTDVTKADKPKVTAHDTSKYRAELTQRIIKLQSGDAPSKPKALRSKTLVE